VNIINFETAPIILIHSVRISTMSVRYSTVTN